MSLESWKTEFYPVEASEATGSTLEALKHSLRKWEGLTEENIDRHGLLHDTDELSGYDGKFYVDSHSCALCEIFLSTQGGNGRPVCAGCPLNTLRNWQTCAGPESPYASFTVERDPLPMIDLIKRAIAIEEGK